MKSLVEASSAPCRASRPVSAAERVVRETAAVPAAVLARWLDSFQSIPCEPEADGDAWVGLRLSARRGAHALWTIGLREGDVVEVVNGVAPRNLAALVLIEDVLRAAQSIVVRFRREGVTRELEIEVVGGPVQAP